MAYPHTEAVAVVECVVCVVILPYLLLRFPSLDGYGIGVLSRSPETSCVPGLSRGKPKIR